MSIQGFWMIVCAVFAVTFRRLFSVFK
jgi:hypothetical protein